MQEQESASWLTLQALPGMNSRLGLRLLERFGSPTAALRADLSVLTTLGAPPEMLEALRLHQSRPEASGPGAAAEKGLRWLEHPHHHLLTWNSQAYPPLLAEIPDPPLLLFVQGQLESLAMPMLAMVGSRNPSPGGRRAARDFAAGLVEAGLGICSGLALGIDQESHLGTLEAGGVTVAVLGSGLDCLYPRRNASLAREISARGAVVSEFALGERAVNWHFPQRNRIVSGLSRGVLVVEAALKSGSLITARLALEQGREVFAVPGSIFNPNARGCHQLIKQGAALVESAADLREELCLLPGLTLMPADPVALVVELSDQEKQVLKCIGYEPVPFDSLVRETGLESQQLSPLLMGLELRGRLTRVAGGYTLQP